MVLPVEKVFLREKNLHARRLHFHLEYCRVRSSNVTKSFIARNHILHIPQPPDSPDLVLSGFGLFDHLKNSFVGWRFDEPDQLLESITSLLEVVHSSELQVVFRHWIHMVRCVLENNRNYYHK
jgi:hypothetical protein